MSITYREIKSQYAALLKTSNHLEKLLAQIGDALAYKKMVFVGSGSSYYVATSAAFLAQSRLNRLSMAIPAGDLLLHMPAYRNILEDAAVIFLSRSGETSEAVRAVSLMREEGIRFSLIAVTCVNGSTLAEKCDLAIELPWAFDESVCQTRTVSCLYYTSVRIVASLAGDAALLQALETVIAKGPEFIEQNEAALEQIAGPDWSAAVVLGDAEIGGLCEEGALAFKEICQLPSNYHHLLDVRHGPMVLIDEKTLVIAALSSANQLELDLLSDLVKKGAKVVAYSDHPMEIPGVLVVPFGQTLPHAARGIPVIAICQLIAYYKSLQTGADPDKPSGLSAWIQL